MFIVFGIKWKEGDVCKIFWANLIKGRVYKERVCAFYIQTIQSVLHWLESERLPTVVLVQEYSGHKFLFINSNLYKEATNNMWKKRHCSQPITICKKVPYRQLPEYQLRCQNEPFLQLYRYNHTISIINVLKLGE